jgi:hypothetical protein
MAHLCQNAQIVVAFDPVNLATAGGTGDYVSLKGYKHVTVLFVKGDGASGEDPTITLYQATTVAGGSAKALTFTTIYVKQGADMAAIGTFTKTTQTAASTYTSATAGEQKAVWAIEIDADQLDVDNGFDCIRADISDVGDTSQIGTVLYILTEPRYAGETMPSAIA